MTPTQATEEILSIDSDFLAQLERYRLLPRFFREFFLQKSIATVECHPEEIEEVMAKIDAEHRLESESDRQAWLKKWGMTPEQFATSVE
jgi:hypothetical protein